MVRRAAACSATAPGTTATRDRRPVGGRRPGGRADARRPDRCWDRDARAVPVSLPAHRGAPPPTLLRLRRLSICWTPSEGRGRGALQPRRDRRDHAGRGIRDPKPAAGKRARDGLGGDRTRRVRPVSRSTRVTVPSRYPRTNTGPVSPPFLEERRRPQSAGPAAAAPAHRAAATRRDLFEQRPATSG
jgi:hypothetical protein